MSKVILEITVEQANALVCALDAYSRLCIGQLDAVTELVNDGTIPLRANIAADRCLANRHAVDAVREHIDVAKEYLGYSRNGSNGIGHPHVHITGHRAWEMRKVVERVMALHRDPNPSFRGVNYDGLLVRYTQDPAPVARVVPSETPA